MLIESIGQKSNNTAKAVIISKASESGYRPAYPSGIIENLNNDQLVALKKFDLFWTMMDTIDIHGYMSAAISLIGRAAVSAWFKLAKNPEFKNEATERQRKKLYSFYYSMEKDWGNIQDFYTPAYKLLIGMMYFRYFGQAAYFKVRDSKGTPIGFDHLPGLIVPNTDNRGFFKSPAFIQYPTSNPSVKVEYKAEDIIYIINPDMRGSMLGGSDIKALAEFTLPLDIYTQTSAREYMKNSSMPELIWMLPADISDEGFNAFVALLESKYMGASNTGRSPIAVQGDVDIKRIDSYPSDLPYSDSRKETRDELLSVSGTGKAMLGVSEDSGNGLSQYRRNFFEQTVLPIAKFFELAFWEQVNVREFSARGWVLKFNNPDFLTEVERSTVHMRRIQNGVYSPNDAREELGKDPREDELGEAYTDHTKGKGSSLDNPQGSPPEGREDRPDAPANTGEPTLDDQDPPRGDQHDEEPRSSMLSRDNSELIAGLREWKRFAINRVKKGWVLREFNHAFIPEDVAKVIQSYLEESKTIEEVRGIFDIVIGELEKENEW